MLGGVLAAPHLRLGQPEPPDLQGAGGRVPEISLVRGTELLRQPLLQLPSHQDDVEEDRENENPERREHGALHGERLEETEHHEDERRDHQELAEVGAGVDELAHVATLRSLVAQRQIALVVGIKGLTGPGPVVPRRRPALLPCGPAIVRDERPLAGRLLHTALGRRGALALRARRLGDTRSAVDRFLGRGGFPVSSEHPFRIPGRRTPAARAGRGPGTCTTARGGAARPVLGEPPDSAV